MKSAINKLAKLHIRASQISEFNSINDTITPYNPVTYAFENYPNNPNRNSDFSFYFEEKDFIKMQESLDRDISSYSKRVFSSEIGEIALNNKDIFEGYWLEKDWKSNVFNRTLIYATIKNHNIAKKELIDFRIQEQLNRLFTASEQESKIVPRQIGAVYLKRLRIGKKIVFKIPSDCLNKLPKSELSDFCINQFKRRFGQINAMLHITQQKWKSTIALELIVPSEERYSAQDFWEELLGSMKYSSVNAKEMYGYERENGKIAISGINHIKIPIVDGMSNQRFRDKTKLYSGIIVRHE